uniref:CCHC-type domain-containing protein n=1 Tax=Cannabis sativa TaxID=3483 RepID=A0A803P4J5_CANSA
MARRGKMAGKIKSKGKKAGPSSSDRVIKTRSMDALIGIQDLEIVEDLETMEQCKKAMEQYSDIMPSPTSEIHQDFSAWLTGANRASQDASLGKNPSPPILRSNIAQKLESYFEKSKTNFLDTQPRVADTGANGKVKVKIEFEDIVEKLKGLDIKYWGDSSLYKIVGQLGEPLDKVTKNRDRLQYPRILIQVSLSQEFPKMISFIDEFNHEIELEVKYEWIPLVCYNCSGIGHDTQSCRKKESKEEQVKQIWIPKEPKEKMEDQVDEKGFQKKREELWGDLEKLAASIQEHWIILGDFNEILYANERVGRKAQSNPSQRLRDYMEVCEMTDMKYSRSFFTWNNKQKLDDRIFSKIDRAMVNLKWRCALPNSEAVFLPELSFDHNPILVSIYRNWSLGKKPFRYYNMWKLAPKFDAKLMEAEQEASRRYNGTHKAFTMFLSQKAKINWASFGDENSAFFHASLKSRKIQNKIFSIEDEHGTWFDSADGVQNAFLNYYEKLLGTNMQNRRSVMQSLVNLGPKITDMHKAILRPDYTNQEVKDAFFSIPGIKAPGQDGFGSAFYQENWDIVGTEITEAIFSFLTTGKISKEINTTTITLIPKIACPKNVADFRPISYCNVLYKTATKIICNRLRKVLPDLIAKNQGCFVHGSHGDFISIMLMLRGMKLFSSTSCLMPNEKKTVIYCSSMAEAEVGRILEASQFKRSSLPFRYLRIPICSKKISISECQILLEKIVSKIRGWSSRNLSYMGRVTLINAVLIAIHTYWAQIMILPKKLLKDIEAICRSYLWKGTQMSMGPGLVAWEHVCLPKSAGGLGLRDIQKWNTTAMTRYQMSCRMEEEAAMEDESNRVAETAATYQQAKRDFSNKEKHDVNYVGCFEDTNPPIRGYKSIIITVMLMSKFYLVSTSKKMTRLTSDLGQKEEMKMKLFAMPGGLKGMLPNTKRMEESMCMGRKGIITRNPDKRELEVVVVHRTKEREIWRGTNEKEGRLVFGLDDRRKAIAVKGRLVFGLKAIVGATN